MPNPTRISLPRVNYNFDAKACVPVLTVMLNKVEKDYSTVDELCDHDELSKFTRIRYNKFPQRYSGGPEYQYGRDDFR